MINKTTSMKLDMVSLFQRMLLKMHFMVRFIIIHVLRMSLDVVDMIDIIILVTINILVLVLALVLVLVLVMDVFACFTLHDRPRKKGKKRKKICRKYFIR